MAAIHVAEYVKGKGLDPAACGIRFGLDPLGSGAVWAYSPYGWGEIVPAVTGAIKGLAAMGFKGPLAAADGRVIHDAGGSEVQELAFVLAAGTAYLRAIEQSGVALEDAQGMVYARLAADADQFMTLAKFRALRLLWARVEQACGLTPKPLFVAADTAWRMLTQRDPYVNMLRATVATFSAGLGGANAITVLPHTLALGLPDPFARRAARNTQLVLLEESNLAKVSDPAAGSGGIEALTKQLCEAAWSLFQEIEKAGGIFAALEQNLIQRKVAATRAVREANIAKRRDVLTGASEFPNLHEAEIAVLDAKPIVLPPYGEAKFKFDPLPPIRLAAPFEALRDKSDTRLKRDGARPKIFLARPPTSPRAPPSPRVFSRPAASRRSTPRALTTRRRSPLRSRAPARPLFACARPTKPMRNTRWPPQRPFKPPAPSISIWQGGPANRRRRCAMLASAISSLPAAMRWRCCRKPGGGWSKHDGKQPQDGPDRRLPMRRHPLCGVEGTRQDQHLPLPDVPEGFGRAVCLLRRDRAGGFHLDPRQAGVVQILHHRRARFLRGLRHAAELPADRRPPDRDHDRHIRPPRPGGADAAIWNRIPARLGGWDLQPAEPDHAAELRAGEDGDDYQPPASGS
jgi:phage tail protein X